MRTCALALSLLGGCTSPDLVSVYGPVVYNDTTYSLTQAQLDVTVVAWLVEMERRGGYNFDDLKAELRHDAPVVTLGEDPITCPPDGTCDGVFDGENIQVRYDGCLATSSLAHELTHLARDDGGQPHDGRYYYGWQSVEVWAAVHACEEGCGRRCSPDEIARPRMVGR